MAELGSLDLMRASPRKMRLWSVLGIYVALIGACWIVALLLEDRPPPGVIFFGPVLGLFADYPDIRFAAICNTVILTLILVAAWRKSLAFAAIATFLWLFAGYMWWGMCQV